MRKGRGSLSAIGVLILIIVPESTLREAYRGEGMDHDNGLLNDRLSADERVPGMEGFDR